MRRKIGMDDFKLTSQASEKIGGSWWFFEDDYTIRNGIIRPIPSYDEEGHRVYWGYDPLEDSPELFLTFARLRERPDFKTSALQWCREYGLPGKRASTLEEIPRDKHISDSSCLHGMSLTDFRQEVEDAWLILTMYEAVLNGDHRAALSYLAPEEIARLKSKGLSRSAFRKRVLNECLSAVCWQVTSVLHDYCYPALQVESLESLEVKSYWRSYNLLGAMYVQFYWLLASGDQVSRCENCGQIMSLSRPHPTGRKRRSDKRFCNDACRQALRRRIQKANS